MIFPLPQPAFLLCFVVAFTYFMLAGGTTFEHDESDELSAMLGQFSFLCTGALGGWFFGRGVTIYLANGAAAAVLLVVTLALYEWARRTIRWRHFHLAWSGEVPDELCEQGPYAWVRHPLYLSYILAFLALLVALPTAVIGAIFLFNLALFTHAAFSDERSLARSPLAETYAGYKRRVGMFLPRLRRA